MEKQPPLDERVTITGPYVAPAALSRDTWRAFHYGWAAHLPSESMRPIAGEDEVADWVATVSSLPSLRAWAYLRQPPETVAVTVREGSPVVEFASDVGHLRMTLSPSQTAPGLLVWHTAQALLTPDLEVGGITHLMVCSIIAQELFGSEQTRRLAAEMLNVKSDTTIPSLLSQLLEESRCGTLDEQDVDVMALSERFSGRVWLPQHVEGADLRGTHYGYFTDGVMGRLNVLFRCLQHRHDVWIPAGPDKPWRFASPTEPVPSVVDISVQGILREIALLTATNFPEVA